MNFIYAIDEGKVYQVELSQGWWEGHELNPMPGHTPARRSFPYDKRDYFRTIPEGVARKIAGLGRNGVHAYFIDMAVGKGQLKQREQAANATIELLLQGMDKRRRYLRRKLERILAKGVDPKPGRGNEHNRLKYTGRAGMLSEHATIRAMLEDIRNGRHPDEMYNEEDDTDDD